MRRRSIQTSSRQPWNVLARASMHLTPSERGINATSESRTVWSRWVSAPPSWVIVDGSKTGSLDSSQQVLTYSNSLGPHLMSSRCVLSAADRKFSI